MLNLINKNPDSIEIIKANYLLLLSELTTTTFIETPLFVKNIKKIFEMGTIIIGYVGDLSKSTFELVATGTIIIEPKIIRGGKSVGHIEDIVVANGYRGKNISQVILNNLTDFAEENGCYKVILDCEDDVKKVYIKNGFKLKGLQLSKYFV